MAAGTTYNVQRAAHETLVANNYDTVVLAEAVDNIEVVNRTGTAEIYFTVNGTIPTVGGNDTYVVLASLGSINVPLGGGKTGVSVILISTGAEAYSVQGFGV